MYAPLSPHAAKHDVSQRYREEQLAGQDPIQLLIRVYDVGIASCQRKDRDRLSRSLIELIAALNFEYREVAVGLFRLYQYCLRQAKAGNFDAVRPVLCDLRDAWSQVRKDPPAPATMEM